MMEFSKLVWLLTLLVMVMYVPSSTVIALETPCKYCSYCQYCSECSKCPCEVSSSTPNCNFCTYCKYCKLCKICDVCKEGGLVDKVTGTLLSWKEYIQQGLGMNNEEVKNLNTINSDVIDKELDSLDPEYKERLTTKNKDDL